MGLVQDVAIVTTSEVAQISGEASLALLDVSPDATLATAVVQATNWLIRRIRAVKGFDPAKVANASDFKEAAALHAAYLRLEGQPDPQMQERAEKLRARRDEAFDNIVIVNSDGGRDSVLEPKGLPMWGQTSDRDRHTSTYRGPVTDER